MVQAVATGGAALACGVPFSWEREMVVDYSLPIGLSGLRLLSGSAAIDGSPASMAGRRVATVSGSLGATAIGTLQPAAKPVSFDSLDAAVSALKQGKVDGVLGDSNVLAGLRKVRNLSATRLVPDEPFATYGVGCIVPQNNSDLINVVNLAIAKQQAAYLEGQPDAVASIDPWVGPNGVLGIPVERIRGFFQSSLLSREALLLMPVPAAKPAP
jgi:polar amino acid transport system substrate-binding protein